MCVFANKVWRRHTGDQLGYVRPMQSVSKCRRRRRQRQQQHVRLTTWLCAGMQPAKEKVNRYIAREECHEHNNTYCLTVSVAGSALN